MPCRLADAPVNSSPGLENSQRFQPGAHHRRSATLAMATRITPPPLSALLAPHRSFPYRQAFPGRHRSGDVTQETQARDFRASIQQSVQFV